jgi:integral membrane protein
MNASQSPSRWSSPVGRFRIASEAEAWSWAGLLFGMFFKYSFFANEIGVRIMGPIHGAFFIFYLLALWQVRGVLKWDGKTTLLAVLASIPPFATIWFERWAIRTGRLPTEDGATRQESN